MSTPTGQQLRAVVETCVQETLYAAMHIGCPMAAQAEYYPAEADAVAQVACGCAEVFDAAELRASSVRTDPDQSPGTMVAQQPADPVNSFLPLIDPSQVYTPVEVEQRILEVVARLEAGAMFERELIIAAHNAEQAYTLANAKAHAQRMGEGSEKDRIALALVDCEDQFNLMTEAVMMRKAIAATMHNLRSILNGYQSVLKSINGGLPYGGSPGGTR